MKVGRRSCAARSEPIDRDAKLSGLVGEIVLDAGAGEDDDPDGHGVQHLVIAAERGRLGVFGHRVIDLATLLDGTKSR